MNKTLKIFVGLIVAAAVVSGGYVFSMSKKPALKEKATYTIGMIAPLTGDVGFVGVGMKDAVLMAQEQMGKTKYNYKFIFEDSRYDPKISASGANKLINVDKVDAIISIGYGGPIVAPLATKYNILHFAIEIQPEIANGENNFIHWTPVKRLVGLLIEEMQKKGFEKVAVFRTVSLPAWIAYMDYFQKGIEGTNIKIVSDQSFQDDEKSFQSMIAMAKQAEPDVYLLLTQVPAIEIVVKQLREAGVDAPLTGIESFEQVKDLSLFEGQWYIGPVDATESFNSAYEAKYEKTPPVCSPNAYDIANLIETAVERAGSSPSEKPPTKAVVRELLKIKNFDGALGNLTVDKEGIVLSEAKVKMILNGKVVTVED